MLWKGKTTAEAKATVRRKFQKVARCHIDWRGQWAPENCTVNVSIKLGQGYHTNDQLIRIKITWYSCIFKEQCRFFKPSISDYFNTTKQTRKQVEEPDDCVQEVCYLLNVVPVLLCVAGPRASGWHLIYTCRVHWLHIHGNRGGANWEPWRAHQSVDVMFKLGTRCLWACLMT